MVVDVVHDASSPSIWNRMDMAAAMIRRGGYAGVVLWWYWLRVLQWFLLPWGVVDPRWRSFNW